MFRKPLAFVAVLVTLSLSVLAEDVKKNEVALLLGVKITTDQTIASGPGAGSKLDVGTGLTFQATYGRRLAGNDRVALFFEVPFLATPSTDVSSTFTAVPRNFASIFITPSLRVNFRPQASVSPWFSAGGGYARFAESTTLIDGTPNLGSTGTNKGAVQFGGGLDFRTPVKLAVPIGLRVEVRDFYSGKPEYGAPTGGGFQHNVIVSGGFLLRF